MKSATVTNFNVHTDVTLLSKYCPKEREPVSSNIGLLMAKMQLPQKCFTFVQMHSHNFDQGSGNDENFMLLLSLSRLRIVPIIMPRLLPSTSIPIHYLFIILPFNAEIFVLTASSTHKQMY
jgi:hypothetical protein